MTERIKIGDLYNEQVGSGELGVPVSVENVQIKTPTGFAKIRSMIKKPGKGIKITTHSGKTLSCERGHLIKTEIGWEKAEDAVSIILANGDLEAIVSKEEINNGEFYDVTIDHPNEYVTPNGMIHHNSHQVFETLKNEGKVKDKDWILIKGKITTAALYQTLFMHRKGTILVFDDADSVWGDQEAANILKAALDSYDVREVSWLSGKTQNVSLMTPEEKEEFYTDIDLRLRSDPTDSKIKFPSTFEYEGHIIFISNLPKNKLDSAVLNRSMVIDMDLTQEEIFERLESILPFIGKKDVDIEAKKEILAFLRKRSTMKPNEMMSIRTFIGAEDVYSSGMPNWRDLLDYIS